ncbi:MAG: phosphatase PAP2 family protein [Bacteriovorax sp.]
MKEWRKYLMLSNPYNREKLWWFSSALFFLGVFVKITSELFEKSHLQVYDQAILLFIGEHVRRSSLNGIAVDITALGSPALITIFSTMAIVALFVLKDRLGILFYLLSVIGGSLWGQLLKRFVSRSRPEIIGQLVEVSGRSYPSGHTLAATITYFSLAILFAHHFKSLALMKLSFIAAGILTLLTAFSRLYLGVHYPSDVISGILFGLSWVLFVTAFFKTFTDRIKFGE